jgi:plastocyanin
MKTVTLLIVIALLALAACATTPNAPVTAPAAAPANTQAQTAPSAAALVQGETVNVRIKDFKFIPDTLNVKTGTTVIWTNEDSARHTVTSDSGTELDSELLALGGSYSHTFNEAGDFAYHCTPHPSMRAKVIIE